MNQEKKIRDTERKADMIRKDLDGLWQPKQNDFDETKPTLNDKLTQMEKTMTQIKQNMKKESENGMLIKSQNVHLEDLIKSLTEKVATQETELRAKIDNQAVTINYMIDSISGLQGSINKLQGGEGGELQQEPRFLNGAFQNPSTSQEFMMVEQQLYKKAHLTEDDIDMGSEDQSYRPDKRNPKKGTQPPTDIEEPSAESDDDTPQKGQVIPSVRDIKPANGGNILGAGDLADARVS